MRLQRRLWNVGLRFVNLGYTRILLKDQQDQNNIDIVEKAIGKNDSLQTLRSRLQGWQPIVFGKLSQIGSLANTWPGEQIVLIALEALHKENGLGMRENGPRQLDQGEWDYFSGDIGHEYTVPDRGGGLALVLRFK